MMAKKEDQYKHEKTWAYLRLLHSLLTGRIKTDISVDDSDTWVGEER